MARVADAVKAVREGSGLVEVASALKKLGWLIG
jgi:hypothetical protein